MTDPGVHQKTRGTIHVDIIVPVHNSEDTVEETVQSALQQTCPEHIGLLVDRTVDLVVCCYDDGSTDCSWEKLVELQKKREDPAYGKKVPKNWSVSLLIRKSSDGIARGAGYARNRCAEMRKQQQQQEPQQRIQHDEQTKAQSPSPPPTTTTTIGSVTPVVDEYICLLDSDDVMHPTRIAEQLGMLLSLNLNDRHRTIVGCRFGRDPPDSTWHYASWANSLSDERLLLEQFREVTVLQPTWMMSRAWFDRLGGYIEAPHPNNPKKTDEVIPNNGDTSALHQSLVSLSTTETDLVPFQLIHPAIDNEQSLRLAEDLRFFHAHLRADGRLRLHPSTLLTYRHRAGQSQSSQTPRRLLLHLRVLAFERAVLRLDWLKTMSSTTNDDGNNQTKFVVWGAGRDGKDFIKALSAEIRSCVACLVDVDRNKIAAQYYVHKEMGIRIPVVHFHHLAADDKVRASLANDYANGIDTNFGAIDKSKPNSTEQKNKLDSTTVQPSPNKRAKPNNPFPGGMPRRSRKLKKGKKGLDYELLPKLPVVVCVAMYRTNGALERNVRSIGRVEGKTLWHFS